LDTLAGVAMGIMTIKDTKPGYIYLSDLRKITFHHLLFPYFNPNGILHAQNQIDYQTVISDRSGALSMPHK
jgi:hypothetical protein